jgi:hypothetical protein
MNTCSLPKSHPRIISVPREPGAHQDGFDLLGPATVEVPFGCNVVAVVSTLGLLLPRTAVEIFRSRPHLGYQGSHITNSRSIKHVDALIERISIYPPREDEKLNFRVGILDNLFNVYVPIYCG